jgi:hypothetical protein
MDKILEKKAPTKNHRYKDHLVSYDGGLYSVYNLSQTQVILETDNYDRVIKFIDKLDKDIQKKKKKSMKEDNDILERMKSFLN